MTAKITDRFKKQLLSHVFDEMTGTKLGDSDNRYYIAIGRSQAWPDEASPTTPQPTERDERLFRYDMQAIKLPEAFSYVVPLKEWSSGSVYVQYNDAVVGQGTSYYIKTEDNNVYVCVRSGKSATGSIQVSSVKPTHTDSTLEAGTDGYIWKYIYTISVANQVKFLTTNWMPISYVDSAASTDPLFQQYTTQNNAIAGQIVGYRVRAGGSGYSTSDTVTVRGDGTGATARIIVDATNKITAVEVGDSASIGTVGWTDTIQDNMGAGYNQATVTITSSGTGADIEPIISKNGLGANATDDLRVNSIMFNIKPEGTVDGFWPTGNDYRQIGILKNPLIYGYDSAGAYYRADAGSTLRQLKMTSSFILSAGFAIDTTISSTDSDAQAYLDYHDNANTVWYHQNEETGFIPFYKSEQVNISGYSSNPLTVDSLGTPDIDIYSGELLYINNTTAITRSSLAGASEDIKVVVKF